MSDASIQHKAPPPNVPLDDNCEPCGSVPFDYPRDEAKTSAEDESRIRRETLFRLLAFLTTRAGTKRIGQRVTVLAFLAGASPFKRQKQLADKLRVSPSRVSQMLHTARLEFAKLARGN